MTVHDHQPPSLPGYDDLLSWAKDRHHLLLNDLLDKPMSRNEFNKVLGALAWPSAYDEIIRSSLCTSEVSKVSLYSDLEVSLLETRLATRILYRYPNHSMLRLERWIDVFRVRGG